MMTSVSILGAPLDLGQARRGVDMGPSAIRYSGLAERLEVIGLDVTDGGNVTAELPEVAGVSDEHVRYLPAILESCRTLGERVAAMVRAGQMPLVLGRGGVLWIDAHGDINTPKSSPSGNVHGMPLAAALGACGFSIDGLGSAPWVDPELVALVGVRELDPGEKALARELNLCVLTMADIDRRGIAAAMHEALTVAQGPSFVHLSLDVDVCDPEIAPGVGTPVRGGLSYREAHLAMELIAEAGLLTSLEVVEVNPILDHANATGDLAVGLVASVLGARIL